jgi:iron complex outermembrane receptor protein
VKGGLSALYGSDAAGGAINVITRKPAEGLSIAAAASIGSSGFSAQQLRVSGTEGPAGWSALLRQERGRGDYQFRDGPDATLLHRNGDDFRITMGDTRFDYTSDEHIHSSLAVSYLKADRGVPGSFIDAQSRATARQGDDMGRAQLTVDWKPGAHLSTMVRSTFLYSHETYEDPSIVVDGAPLFSKHLNRSFWLTPEACFSISPKFSGTLGAEFSGGWLRSSETRDATRWQQSVFLSTQYTMDLPGEIVLYPSLRYDHFTDVEGGVSPRLGMNIRILEDPLLRVRASYGTSFRVPTFNELYWKEGGNPSLKPEHSRSFDTGLLFTVSVFGTLGVDVGYFSIVTDNRIVWTPGNNDIWSPKNISSVGSEGVEAGGTWKGFGDLVVLELNSTWDRIRKTSQDFPGDPSENKLLPNIPQQTVNAALLLHVAPFAFSVQHSWVSFRFVDEINSESLPGYPLTSASVCCSFAVWNIKTTVKVEGTNIFNTSYQVIAHYPMPLREFRATLGAEL